MTTLSTPAVDALDLLLVDDHQVDRRTASRQLERGGFHVRVAADGYEALAMAARAKPAGIVMDVRMPGLTGVHVVERIRTDPALRDVPIVLISAEHDHDAVQRALNAGADDFLPKPIDFWQLRARLAMILYERTARIACELRQQVQWACDVATEGVIGVDASGRVTLLNAAARRLLPGPAAPLVGSVLHEHLAAYYQLPLGGALQSAITGRGISPTLRLFPQDPRDPLVPVGPITAKVCGGELAGYLVHIAPLVAPVGSP